MGNLEFSIVLVVATAIGVILHRRARNQFRTDPVRSPEVGSSSSRASHRSEHQWSSATVGRSQGANPQHSTSKAASGVSSAFALSCQNMYSIQNSVRRLAFYEGIVLSKDVRAADIVGELKKRGVVSPDIYDRVRSAQGQILFLEGTDLERTDLGLEHAEMLNHLLDMTARMAGVLADLARRTAEKASDAAKSTTTVTDGQESMRTENAAAT